MTFSYEKYLFSPQAKQWWENVPKHLKITKSPRKIILGDFVLMLEHRNTIDATAFAHSQASCRLYFYSIGDRSSL